MSRSRRRLQNQRTILGMLETTPAEVTQETLALRTDEPPPDIDFDWRPQPLARAVRSNRTYRWPVVTALVAIGVAAAVALVVASAIPQRRADDRLDAYRAELSSVETTLSASREALEADLTTTSIPLVAVSRLEASASDLRTTATEPLPDTLPIIPSGAIDALEEPRAALLRLADELDTLTTDAATAAAHQRATESILNLPPLPFTVPTSLVDEVAIALTTMQSDTVAALAELPTHPAFIEYRDLVGAAVDFLADWNDRYLLALRREDTETTTELVAELRARVTVAEAARNRGLEQLGATLITDLAEAQGALDAAIVLTG